MRGLWGSRLGAGLVALALAISLPVAPPVAAATGSASSTGFCAAKKPLRDFGLSQLPPLREAPGDGEPLPFAPRVNVYGSDGDEVYPGIGGTPEPLPIGFGLSTRNPHASISLGWSVTAQLWRISREGRPLHQVASTALEIDQLDGADRPYVTIDLPGRPGFYRYDIQFAGRAGQQLGAYGSYLRVVRPFWQVRLGLDSRTYRPGERVRMRVENYGSRTVTFGEDFRVERRVDGRWGRDRELTPDGFFLGLRVLHPGEPTWCEVLYLPRSVESGYYRIVKTVGLGSAMHPERRLTAPFAVR